MGELPYPQFSYMIYMIFIIYTSHHSLHTTTELAPDLLTVRLHSSVGRASHWYHRGHGFKSHWSSEL